MKIAVDPRDTVELFGIWQLNEIARNGEVANPTSNDANVKAVRHFNELLSTESRVIATVIE